jgi:hypothetical protein
MYLTHLRIVLLHQLDHRFTNRGAPYTVFSFTDGQTTYNHVRVWGHPTLATGDVLSVLLPKADDWQSVIGWKNWTTSIIHLQPLAQHLWMVWLSLFVTCVFGVLVYQHDGHGWNQPWWLIGLGVLVSSYQGYQWHIIRRAHTSLQQLNAPSL